MTRQPFYPKATRWDGLHLAETVGFYALPSCNLSSGLRCCGTKLPPPLQKPYHGFYHGASNPFLCNPKKLPAFQTGIFLATVDKNNTVSKGFKWFHSKMKP